MARDPVCGAEVTEAAWTLHYHGVTYVFCSALCRDAFEMRIAPGELPWYRRWLYRLIEANRRTFGRSRMADHRDMMSRGFQREPPFSQTSHEAVDPVCRMQVHPGTAAASVEHEGQTFFFCSPLCRDRFEADPGHFLNKRTTS